MISLSRLKEFRKQSLSFRKISSKKADMTMPKLVGIILAVLVLFVMSFMIYNAFKNGEKSNKSISDNSVNQATGGICEFPGLGQTCMDGCSGDYIEVNGKCDNSGQKCCKLKS
jgi:hypothetical protein